jgi:N-acetylneuraminic acid mutarotase
MSGSSDPRAIGPGAVAPRRVLFGLLDADGWGWAGVRSVLWTLVIILMLGYIPDRAYYLTVSPTVELGLNMASLVNICPGENEGLPCPAPAGALIPWKSATEADLPGDGVDGSLLQAGSHLYYVGGTIGAPRLATTNVSVATIDAAGLSAWAAGTPLPEARAHAGVAFFAGKAYIIGGASDTAPATASVYVGTPDATSGLITAWERLDALELPAARSGASVTVVSDGIVVLGGEGTDRSSATTVWKAKLGASGELEPWADFMELPEPRSFAAAAVVGDSIYVWGGNDASGPAAGSLRGDIAVAPAAGGGHSAPVVSPDAEAQGDAEIGTIFRWRATEGEGNLPTPRDGAAMWSANGTLYLAGGTVDGTATPSVLWAAPAAATGIAKWTSVELSDLPADAARVGASGVVIGAHVLLLGGSDASGAYNAGALSAGTSPKAPVFRVGLFGLTVPGLALQGEVGQQIGFLSAAGAWTLNFVIMLGAAVAYGQRERFRAWVGAKLGRKGASAR